MSLYATVASKEGQHTMPKRDTITLLDVSFSRTSAPSATATTHITYTMRKGTPYGELTASATVDFLTFMSEGPAQMDGKMYADLSAQLNREETDRLLEGCANTNFGVEEEVA